MRTALTEDRSARASNSPSRSIIDIEGRKVGRARRPTRRIAQDELGLAIAQDSVDRRGGQFPVDRHRDKAGAHDAEKSGEKLPAVRREDRHPLADDKAASQEPA